MVFSLYLPNTGLSEIITLPHLLLELTLSLLISVLLTLSSFLPLLSF